MTDKEAVEQGFEVMTPTDEDYDDMHHALGRPINPAQETYRNYYCCSAETEQPKRFEDLGWWDFVTTINNGRNSIYSVNGAGKQALAEWLGAKT